LRSENDAVVVGIGTVLADDPKLDVRLTEGPNPLRVIVDSTLRIPPEAAVFAGGEGSVVLATTDRSPQAKRRLLERRGSTILVLQEREGKVDLHALFISLREMGVDRALVEGGSKLITSLLRERLPDRMVAIIAPKLIGAGLNTIGELGSITMDDAISLTEVTIARSGEDLVVRGNFAWSESLR
jgi:diaminohydroxyphosphoribosylaminopyrimidine deaminase / 5-amino-6-(5-phosphoribosylamino)uracil reductase